MRIPIFLTILGASSLALAAHAQEAQPMPPANEPSMSQPAPDGPMPADDGTSPMPAAPAMDSAAPSPPAAYNATPDNAPPMVEAPAPKMMQQSPVEQAVAPPPAEYPVCSRTVTDACRNPGAQ